MTKYLQRPGAVGALLDVYEKAISEMIEAIKDIPDGQLILVIDHHTTDENGRTIQAILSHVVHSGFGYATSILQLKDKEVKRPAKSFHESTENYIMDLQNVFSFTHDVLTRFTDHELETMDDQMKIQTGWGQRYDIEQLMEHAIVHILRHTRQLKKIKEFVLT